MNKSKNIKVALIGNPNCGKTSLFNNLTGLKQKVGNFSGVTIDKKIGTAKYENSLFEIIDLPGLYSLVPKSLDESIVRDVLLDKNGNNQPDVILILLDATNLKRNLYLTLQVLELGKPIVIALNMMDLADKQGLTISKEKITEYLGVPVVQINAKKGEGIDDLLEEISQSKSEPKIADKYDSKYELIPFLKNILPEYNEYELSLILFDYEKIDWLSEEKKELIRREIENNNFSSSKNQLHEISSRYKYINKLTDKIITENKKEKGNSIHDKMDYYFTHPVWGLLIFVLVFFLLFQAIFTLAAYPADLIDTGMGMFNDWAKSTIPEGKINDFITDGIIAGIGGIVVFIPQIMILFGLITLLEDSGYMARASFINDKLLEKVGMNGKSFVPLIGAFACAVPAIMAARSISNPRERLITIFITPLMSCSARLPVYIFLIAFIIPNETVGGFFSLQGLLMLSLYMLGVIMSIIVAVVMNNFLPKREKGIFVMELPSFKVPPVKNMITSMINNSKTFVLEAGKIIIIVSIILWFLASFGPGESFKNIETKFATEHPEDWDTSDEIQREINSEKLKQSYAGIMGRFIEPAIRPLGFDWKSGIALITSFAAREVYVGTMSTIYGIEADTSNVKELKAELKKLKNPETGKPLFSIAVAFSLLVFYVFAMQCVSTVVIVKRETGGWKWPIIQFFTFTAIAYVLSFITFQVLS